MLNIFEKSRCYKLTDSDYRQVLHNQLLAVDLLIILHLDHKLEPELLEMLNKMIAALKIDQNKVEYLVFENSLPLLSVMNSFSCKQVVIFGAETDQLDLNMDLINYKSYHFNDYSLLKVNDIVDIYGNQNLKSKLWSSINKMLTK